MNLKKDFVKRAPIKDRLEKKSCLVVVLEFTAASLRCSFRSAALGAGQLAQLSMHGEHGEATFERLS